MTVEQGMAFAVVAGMMVLFIWGRPRYDITACLALVAATALGLVKPEEAFSGFSHDIVIIVASALVVSSGIAQTGILEAGLKLLLPRSHSFRLQLLVMVATVTLLSAFVKNIGALAIMIPVAFHLADIALNRDHRWRAKLAEAVFPAYLVHQTIIVLLGWYLLRFNLPNGVLFMLIGSAVVAGSALAYELAKRIGPLGIVLGVTSRADRQGTQCPAVSRAF